MRIDRLELKNFRCFDDRAFYFDRRFTLLVGANATGKTAILDSLAVALGAALIPVHVPTRTIRPSEVRRTWRRIGETLQVEEHYPARVLAEGVVDGVDLEWMRELRTSKSRTTKGDARDIRDAMAALLRRNHRDDHTLFPFIGYYGTGRLWSEQRLMKKGPQDPAKPTSRFSAYHNCLNPASSERHLMAWVKRWALIQAQRKGHLATLRTVLEAIAACVEGAAGAYFDFEQDDLVLEFSSGLRMPFSLLSDGQRSVGATVADIAMRCTQINPHLSGSAPLETPGVVLIDELDQHLHPRWQRSTIHDLLETFPKIQFVATSHSPFIIQSVDPGHVVNLDDGDIHKPGPQSIEDIVENVMGVEQPQRSRRFQQMVKAAEEYLRALDDTPAEPDSQTISELRETLDRLEAPFADNPAYVAFLRLQRSRASEPASEAAPSGSADATG